MWIKMVIFRNVMERECNKRDILLDGGHHGVREKPGVSESPMNPKT